MKKYLIVILALGFVLSCKNETKNNTVLEETIQKEISYTSFGEKITVDSALSKETMLTQFKNMKAGDTINTKMVGKINEVCSKKGCWMKLDLGDEKEVMVRFKDYGFFMPLDAKGEVVISGKAFVTETSVEDLRHYAEDAEKSTEEIEAIIKPKLTYAFEAYGVLLKE